MTKADQQNTGNTSPSTAHGGARRKLCFPFLLLVMVTGCAIFASRPVQEMSDTGAAIRAAREVQADILAPELYRQSNEWFFKAKREYKFKNFDLARNYADKARFYAENAEFEAIRNGGNRTEAGTTDPMASGINGPPAPTTNAPTPTSTPYNYPTPQGTSADTVGNTPAPGPMPSP